MRRFTSSSISPSAKSRFTTDAGLPYAQAALAWDRFRLAQALAAPDGEVPEPIRAALAAWRRRPSRRRLAALLLAARVARPPRSWDALPSVGLRPSFGPRQTPAGAAGAPELPRNSG